MPKKVKPGINDLQTLYPEIAETWDYELNGDLTPEMVMPGSGIYVWWKCNNKACNHKWNIPVKDRVKSKGCPKCVAKKAAPGKDLLSVEPLLCEEWDYELNGDLTPDMVSYGSKEKVYWRCKSCRKSWKAAVYNRTGDNKAGCPECRKEKQTSFPEQAIMYYMSQIPCKSINRFTAKWLSKESGLKKSNIELDVYIPTLCVGIEYDGQRFHTDSVRDIEKNTICEQSGITLFRIRENECPALPVDSIVKSVKAKDESDLTDAIRWIVDSINKMFGMEISLNVDIERDRQDIYNQMELSKKENSLLETNPEIASEWDYEMNKNLTPDMFLPKSGRKVYWICPDCGESYLSQICHRTNGHAHSKCSHRKGAKRFWDAHKNAAIQAA